MFDCESQNGDYVLGKGKLWLTWSAWMASGMARKIPFLEHLGKLIYFAIIHYIMRLRCVSVSVFYFIIKKVKHDWLWPGKRAWEGLRWYLGSRKVVLSLFNVRQTWARLSIDGRELIARQRIWRWEREWTVNRRKLLRWKKIDQQAKLQRVNIPAK